MGVTDLQATKPNPRSHIVCTMKTRTKVIVAAVAALVCTLLFTEGILTPKQLQPDALPLKFIGYDDPEPMTATFEMENGYGSTIVVWEYATLITRVGNSESKQPFTLERTEITHGKTKRFSVPVARSNDWRVAFQVARFGPRQKKQFESGTAVDGTIVYSEWITPHSEVVSDARNNKPE